MTHVTTPHDDTLVITAAIDFYHREISIQLDLEDCCNTNLYRIYIIENCILILKTNSNISLSNIH